LKIKTLQALKNSRTTHQTHCHNPEVKSHLEQATSQAINVQGKQKGMFLLVKLGYGIQLTKLECGSSWKLHLMCTYAETSPTKVKLG
jgi:hypothetical protein